MTTFTTTTFFFLLWALVAYCQPDPCTAPSRGPVHSLPLLGSYSDTVNPNVAATIVGDPVCTNFEGPDGYWFQTCPADRAAALSLSSPTESGNFSTCAAFFLTDFTSDATFFGCTQTATSDCLIVSTLQQFGLLVVQLNPTGEGQGNVAVFDTFRWYHVCASYNVDTGLLTSYVNGQQIDNVTVWHTSSSYGTPAVAQNLRGAVANWKVFNVELTSDEVAELSVTDTPSPPPLTPPGPFPPPPADNTGLARFNSILATRASTSLVRAAFVGWGTSSSYVGLLRDHLQNMWGDGGTGFTSILHTGTLEAWISDSWHVHPTDDHSVDVYTTIPNSHSFFTVRGSMVSILFVKNPRGAAFDVYVDGALTQSLVDTKADEDTSVTLVLPELSPDTHTIQIFHSGDAGEKLIIQGIDAVNPTGVVVDMYANEGVSYQTSLVDEASLVIVEPEYSNAISMADFSDCLNDLLSYNPGVDSLFIAEGYWCSRPDLADVYAQYTAVAANVTNALIDVNDLYSNCSEAQDAGYYSDGTHLSDVGALATFRLLCPLFNLVDC